MNLIYKEYTMTNKVCLYIATHNKTGLKYFGKTIRYLTEESLQENYHGSGTFWRKHLNEYGDDVTMKIYGIYNLEEVENKALTFSLINNIVKSTEWANRIVEDGLNNGSGGNVYKSMTEEEKIRTNFKKSVSTKAMWAKIPKEERYRRNKKTAEKTNQIIKGKKVSEWRKNYFKNETEEDKIKRSNKLKEYYSKNSVYCIFCKTKKFLKYMNNHIDMCEYNPKTEEYNKKLKREKIIYVLESPQGKKIEIVRGLRTICSKYNISGYLLKKNINKTFNFSLLGTGSSIKEVTKNTKGWRLVKK